MSREDRERVLAGSRPSPVLARVHAFTLRGPAARRDGSGFNCAPTMTGLRAGKRRFTRHPLAVFSAHGVHA